MFGQFRHRSNRRNEHWVFDAGSLETISMGFSLRLAVGPVDRIHIQICCILDMLFTSCVNDGHLFFNMKSSLTLFNDICMYLYILNEITFDSEVIERALWTMQCKYSRTLFMFLHPVGKFHSCVVKFLDLATMVCQKHHPKRSSKCIQSIRNVVF